MATERITENIVRKHFEKYTSDIIIEEQKSKNPKIDRLLKNASKKGNKHGLPEFIISFKSNQNFIIVIECKKSITRHESEAMDKYADYAVDGVRLYASFLAKEYDVLGIAVSGQNLHELKVSHFLHIKGENAPVQKFGNKLLDASNYLSGYLASDEKKRQDYYKLMEYSIILNNKFEHEKILANIRGLFLSCVLIALDNRTFKKSYRDYEDAKDLADFLVNTVVIELKKTLPAKKVENLSIQFGFIKSDTTFTTKKNPETNQNILTEFIDDIDENVNQFIKTYKYFDVLGQLYVEFLSYANNDKGLGIVLTPPHITELFSDLAGVNKDSICFDNCTGTAGFLISAMSKMIKDAKGDEDKILQIKQHQLVGVEYQAHIYALAATNMYIHKDGKSNIIHGDCTDKPIMDEVRKYKPTVGLLNPPYPNDKKKGINELVFILNNLECLEPNGICVAIIPMERVFSAKKETLELKRQLMQLHTLEAVMSMPDELFYNTDNGVVTAIVVFKAHIPHPENKETYFGYWKDDGFEKRKHKGRVDAYNNWHEIKSMWLKSYINRKSEPGISVTKVVTYKDEWCAENYMETDYTKLTKEDFIKSVKEYVLFNELFLKNV